MDDEKIIKLFFDRSESAIKETDKKYGRFCNYIANHILRNFEDAEECVNDTYLALWNLIPPNNPDDLRAYIGALARNTALNRYDFNNAAKRSAITDTVLDEFCECISSDEPPLIDEIFFKELINKFLASLDKRSRTVFMQRYWYLCSVKEISSLLGMSEANVKVTLHRTRNKLKEILEKEGITV